MTGLAKEYAEALYELARDEDIRLQLHDELMQIDAILRQQPTYVRLLTSRAIERGERLKALDQAFAGKAHAYIVSFMKLLVERERFDAFEDCVKWFHSRCNEDYGIVEAEVVSANQLTDEEQNALRTKLEQLSGRKVSMHLRIDPSVLGGVRVEMDGKRYDNTIQSKLGRLKRSLAKGM